MYDRRGAGKSREGREGGVLGIPNSLGYLLGTFRHANLLFKEVYMNDICFILGGGGTSKEC